LSRTRRRGWIVRRALLLADTIGIGAAILVVALAGEYTPWLLLSWPLYVLLGTLNGIYGSDEKRAHHGIVDDAAGIFQCLTASSFLVLVMSLLIDRPVDTVSLVSFWSLTLAFVIPARVAAYAVIRRTPTYVQRTIIVGAGDVGQLIARKIMQHPEYGINLLGFVDANPKDARADLPDMEILGRAEDVRSIVKSHDVERVMVAFSGESNEDTLSLVRSLRSSNVQIDIVPRLFEAVGPSADIHAIEGLPLLGLPSVRITRTSRWFKRSIDILGSSILLVLTAPLFAYIALRVRGTSTGPVMFQQERLGLNMKPFMMLKFRTMYADTDHGVHRDYIQKAMDTSIAPNANGLYKLDRNDSITPVGRWLRGTSLDELPQLVNVLRGDMSLVGPRPCIDYETEFFQPHHFERFLVPQGITGLWQVEGRALMTPREALDLDVAYVRGWSLRLDFSLLLRTFSQVVFRTGAA